MTRPQSRSVLQDWVADLTMMQQSVLLTAVRGPDGLPKYHPVKYVVRWYRRCVLLSSFMHQVIDNPVVSDGGSFLGPSVEARCYRCGSTDAMHDFRPHDDDADDHDLFVQDLTFAGWAEPMNNRITAYLAALDEVPLHFHLHLLHAIEIVGYKHPDPVIGGWWRDVYLRLVRDLHLQPESCAQLDERLVDTREGWLAHGDVATNA